MRWTREEDRVTSSPARPDEASKLAALLRKEDALKVFDPVTAGQTRDYVEQLHGGEKPARGKRRPKDRSRTTDPK
ncbi:MAG: hypothetical protein IPK78_20575 [Rhodospirillales bacterium]|nr:hypothetical protein [Rhodospirillales bacterium]